RTFLAIQRASLASRSAPSVDTLFSFRCSAGRRELHSFPTRRSSDLVAGQRGQLQERRARVEQQVDAFAWQQLAALLELRFGLLRSEEHTSELQSRENLVCRLLLEKKKL